MFLQRRMQTVKLECTIAHLPGHASSTVRLWKFKHQHRPAAGHAVGNEAPQALPGGARIKKAVPHKGEQLLKLHFGQDDRGR